MDNYSAMRSSWANWDIAIALDTARDISKHCIVNSVSQLSSSEQLRKAQCQASHNKRGVGNVDRRFQ